MKKLQNYHFKYCFDVLKAYVEQHQYLPNPPEELLSEKGLPLFVTLYSHGEEKRLRGCIGCFSSNDENIAKTLQDFTYWGCF